MGHKVQVVIRYSSIISLILLGVSLAAAIIATFGEQPWLTNTTSPTFAPTYTKGIDITLWQVSQSVKYSADQGEQKFTADIKNDCKYTLDEQVTGWYYYQYKGNCTLFNFVRFGIIAMMGLTAAAILFNLIMIFYPIRVFLMSSMIVSCICFVFQLAFLIIYLLLPNNLTFTITTSYYIYVISTACMLAAAIFFLIGVWVDTVSKRAANEITLDLESMADEEEVCPSYGDKSEKDLNSVIDNEGEGSSGLTGTESSTVGEDLEIVISNSGASSPVMKDGSVNGDVSVEGESPAVTSAKEGTSGVGYTGLGIAAGAAVIGGVTATTTALSDDEDQVAVKEEDAHSRNQAAPRKSSLVFEDHFVVPIYTQNLDKKQAGWGRKLDAKNSDIIESSNVSHVENHRERSAKWSRSVGSSRASSREVSGVSSREVGAKKSPSQKELKEMKVRREIMKAREEMAKKRSEKFARAA
eukprot:Nk52_evm1s1319 gene=Nk52_evmTU1s1319